MRLPGEQVAPKTQHKRLRYVLRGLLAMFRYY